MIKQRQSVKTQTKQTITVSMIDEDLKNGINKEGMMEKYGIKKWEVDEMFKHPFLTGRRPSRKKALSFTFVDDMTESTQFPNSMEDVTDEPIIDPNQVTLEVEPSFNEKVAQERADSFNKTLESAVEAIDPNQITLEQAIDEAIETVEEVKDQMQETQEAIVEMLNPTEFETPTETLSKVNEVDDSDDDGDEYISDEVEVEVEEEDEFDSFEL